MSLVVQLVLGILAIYLEIPTAFSVISRVLVSMFEFLAAFGSFYWKGHIRSGLNETGNIRSRLNETGRCDI